MLGLDVTERQPSAAVAQASLGQAIPRAELTRLEGLGDNCELGFVLRRMGFDDGMLLRWASIKPDRLLATLRGDFEHLYEFENLVPQNPKMVRDLHYGTSWHSEMRSARVGGELAFLDSLAERRVIHAKEADKLAYLVAKLRRKLEHPNPVFVIKSNGGIPEDVLEGIHYQLYRRATSSLLVFVDVQADPARAGRLEVLGRNRLRGFVTRFASYDQADDGDDVNWCSVLAQALAYRASGPVSGTTAVEPRAPQPVILSFPSLREPQLLAPIPGDVRAGLPHLIGGNAWCRPLDDMYRLHASLIGPAATTMRWTGVHAAPGSTLCLTGGCAIVESKPIIATLQARDAAGETATAHLVFETVEDQQFRLAIPGRFVNPLCLSLIVEPVAPLPNGERAVIDIQPLQIFTSP